jgi:TolB protein
VRIQWLTALLLLCVTSIASGQLTIEITQGNDSPTPIAIVPFSEADNEALSVDIPAVIGADLYRSGVFSIIDKKDMLSLPDKSGDVFYRDWRAIGSEYVLVGRLEKILGPRAIQLEYELMDVQSQQVILTGTLTGQSSKLRDLAHAVADDVYEKVSGIAGAFATKVIYVSAVHDNGKNFSYRLMLSDADGFGEKIIFESKEPIMSPSWSPDGKQVAYVSFETRKAAIYIQTFATGRRERLTDFPGINGAPAWSPDGTKMAMVLSKGNNPDIYIMDLLTKQLTRLASHFAIDTEPAWSSDGKAVIFTSDRGGKPQIYKVTLKDNWVERLTFEGDYNARARMLPDDRGMIMIHGRNGGYHVALQMFDTGRIYSLSKTSLDESPTIAPNGAMLMYATQYGKKGILAAVSIDGSVKYRLPSTSSDVREPAWSPFLD